jgi:hypothetical protein
MDSNQLLHYLRGFFELVDEPTPAQIRAIRNEVLRAKPVTAEIIPVEVVDPIKRVTSGRSAHGGCGGCGGAPPSPYIDRDKIPS